MCPSSGHRRHRHSTRTAVTSWIDDGRRGSEVSHGGAAQLSYAKSADALAPKSAGLAPDLSAYEPDVVGFAEEPERGQIQFLVNPFWAAKSNAIQPSTNSNQ